MNANATSLASYAINTQFKDLPVSVIDRARWVLIDTIGCMLGGGETVLGRTAINALTGLAGVGTSSVIGSATTTDPVTAAFVNSILSDALDYEDTLLAHPSAAVVPAALAMGEHVGSSGQDLLLAIVIGYEIGVRIGKAVMPGPERASEIPVQYGWLGFGATSAAGKICGLDIHQYCDAFGYVGACSPLPTWISKWERPLHWVKNNFGEQTRAGVLAIIMAQNGFVSPRGVLDSDFGFWRMSGSDRYRPEVLTQGLGKDWVITETTFKPYPCCRYIHTTLDAVQEIRCKHGIIAEQVDRVIVRSFSEMTDWFDDYRPASIVDAEFSVPYTVALMLEGYQPGPEWYDSSNLLSPNLHSLADRVELVSDEAMDDLFRNERRYAAEVTIITTDGRQLRSRRDWPRGGNELPLSESQMLEKFRSLAYGAMTENRAESLLGLLNAIDKCSDVREIGRLIREDV